MKKYILYTFLVIFAFSTASFGGEEDEKDRPRNVLKIRDKEISWDLLIKAGRPGGLSPQTHVTHVNSNKENSSPLCSRGTTFYIPEERLKAIFEENP